jgi:hypothetical protein
MAYIGQGIKEGTFSVLDTSGNTYNGSNVTFSLGTQVGSPAQLLVSHDGVIQKPGTDYSLATGGTQITFSTAPASGASIFIVEISGAVGGPLDSDLNGAELILDADADTSITADTDDQIDVKIGGSDRFKFDNSGHLSLLTDSAAIKFGADSDVTLTHDPDDGLFFKSAATADNNPVLLTLQTGETDMAADDVIGKISFQAPDEGTGTDAILVSAAVQAVAEGDHSSSSNATRLEFMTGASEAATTQMSISSGGIVGIGAVPTGDLGVGLHIKTADSGQGTAGGNADELVIEGSGDVGLSILSGNSSTGCIFFGDDGASDIGQIRYDHDDNDLIFRANNGDRGRFDSNGDFLVSCSSLPSASVKGFGIDNKGSIGMIVTATNTTSADSHYQTFNSNGQVGSIQTSGTSTSFNTSSDYRLKENVSYTWDATTRLKQLKPARFNFKTDTDTTVDGFIAHEVSSIVPEAIAGEKDGMEVETRYTADDVETQGDSPSKNVGDPKTYSSTKISPQQIDQAKLVPLLVKTVQELEARIKTLEDA